MHSTKKRVENEKYVENFVENVENSNERFFRRFFCGKPGCGNLFIFNILDDIVNNGCLMRFFFNLLFHLAQCIRNGGVIAAAEFVADEL